MKLTTTALLLTLSCATTNVMARTMTFPTDAIARLYRRQSPQEHSHDTNITIPFREKCFVERGGLADPVIGLLGDGNANKNAPNGNGKCLQQLIADFALTNAKQKKTGAEQTECIRLAIMYRSLERNTQAVGKPSLDCDLPPTNPELAGIRQHQDAASPGATEHNKQVEMAVAAELGKLGIPAEEAKEFAKLTATFPPGKQATDRQNRNSSGLSCNPSIEDAPDCADGKLVPAASDEELLQAAQSKSAPAVVPAAVPVSAPAPAANDAGNPLVAPLPGSGSESGTPTTPPAKCRVTVTVAPAALNAATPLVSAPAPAANVDAAVVTPAVNAAVDAPLAQAATPSPTDTTPAPAAAPAASGCSRGLLFGLNFNGRSENAFAATRPNGAIANSALRFGVLSKFVCDEMKHEGKDATCQALCSQAIAAGEAAPEGGAQADAFNAVLGLTTNFATTPADGNALKV